MPITYSGVTATLALVVAVSSGGAYATDRLLPKNSIATRQIKNGQVRSADLHKNAVKASKVAPNALTGADIDEARLARVPAARRADHATTADNVLAAVVSADGVVDPGASSPGVTAERVGPGQYDVSFRADVASCSISASLYSPSGAPVDAAFVGAFGNSSKGPAVVTVRALSAALKFEDTPVTVVAIC